ncbi:hypothetical protein ES332_A01G185300v1 [Gossypium tomentosum]|uniref:Uncharacterized protein n=1 Tax=Gossypium tomentosum TaxID=34277 RepID=A0A5D2RT09_GOSTO|nr:hypothetical protein ES332_A01G185300v1 [Gossypium tomentosum]
MFLTKLQYGSLIKSSSRALTVNLGIEPSSQTNIFVDGRSGGDNFTPSIFSNHSRTYSEKISIKSESKLILISFLDGGVHVSPIVALTQRQTQITCLWDLNSYQKPK